MQKVHRVSTSTNIHTCTKSFCRTSLSLITSLFDTTLLNITNVEFDRVATFVLVSVWGVTFVSENA